MLRWKGRRSFRAEFGDVLAKTPCRIELRQQFDWRDFERLAEEKHLKVAHPDELTLDLRHPRAINLPAENLKPRCKVGLFETEIVAPLSHLRPNYILVHCAHVGTSRSLKFPEKAPIREPNSRARVLQNQL